MSGQHFCQPYIVTIPSPMLASDYSGMVTDLLLFLAAAGGLALFAGVATSAVLFWVSRRKWAWLFVPIFVLCWLALILALFELWGAL